MSAIASFLRQLPYFKGKSRLAKLLCKKAILNNKNLSVKGKFGCSYLLPNLLETVSFEIFINGVYEQETSDYLSKVLPNGATFLDLGANIGAISVPLFAQRNDIKMVCVEAAPWLFEYLKTNLDRNNIFAAHTVNKALYNKDNEELNFYSPKDKFGKGSLSPVFTDEGVKVRTITLDTLVKELGIAKVHLVKIDVEGYECHVFEGGKGLLQLSDAPDILFEFVDWAETKAGLSAGSAQNFLLNSGYTLFQMDKQGKCFPLKKVLNRGSAMLLASKRKLSL